MQQAFAYFKESHYRLRAYSLQVNVKHAAANVPKKQALSEFLNPWDYIPLFLLKKSFEEYGIQLSVIEGPPPMEHIKVNGPRRDEEIDHFCEFLKNISRLDIHTVCYNWMPVFGWFRSKRNIPTRGDARVTGFDYSELYGRPWTELGMVTPEMLWENLEYFLKRVIPVAEEYDVKLAIHPDDPPVPELSGISRILTSSDALWRVMDLVPSKCNGITFCQGSLAAAGENILASIRRFAEQNKIFFIHFRDIRGDTRCFEETFHDDGKTDMYEVLKCYNEFCPDSIIRLDHVPSMYGEMEADPGYGILGNLYAAGYLNGLMEAAESESGKHDKGGEKMN